MQLTHYNTQFPKHTFPITIICDDVNTALNIGSLFRICDAFGVEKIIFCGNNISIGRKMTKTSRSTEKHVQYKIVSDISEVITEYKDSHQLIGLEITSNSKPLKTFKFNTHKPIALILGNENFGISENILKQLDTTVHITMYGHNSSMNVVQAASIALYEITKQYIYSK